jgi:hypothetical protein
VAKHFILLYVVIVKELNRLGESHYVKISNRTIVGSPFYAAAHQEYVYKLRHVIIVKYR